VVGLGQASLWTAGFAIETERLARLGEVRVHEKETVAMRGEVFLEPRAVSALREPATARRLAEETAMLGASGRQL
jgi:hypothetical protein